MTAPLIQAACAFAIAAHGPQVRKYTGAPYWTHCEAVARLVADAGGDAAMVAAAWLHDTVEDTAITIDDVRREFGNSVSDLVYWLTDVSRLEDGNRATRKAMDRAHIAHAPARAQVIKLADLIDNTATIATHDPHFAKVYMAEKRLLLDALRPAVSGWPNAAPLLERAERAVSDYFSRAGKAVKGEGL